LAGEGPGLEKQEVVVDGEKRPRAGPGVEARQVPETGVVDHLAVPGGAAIAANAPAGPLPVEVGDESGNGALEPDAEPDVLAADEDRPGTGITHDLLKGAPTRAGGLHRNDFEIGIMCGAVEPLAARVPG